MPFRVCWENTVPSQLQHNPVSAETWEMGERKNMISPREGYCDMREDLCRGRATEANDGGDKGREVFQTEKIEWEEELPRHTWQMGKPGGNLPGVSETGGS